MGVVMRHNIMLLQANSAPKSEPLSSWFSFEDPGPLPPMPTPTTDDTTSTGDFRAPPTSTTLTPACTPVSGTTQPFKPTLSSTGPTKQAQKVRSNDPWATPVEPPVAEVELLSATLAGLGGDAWGGSSFGPDMGKPMALEAESQSQVPNQSAIKPPQGLPADSASACLHQNRVNCQETCTVAYS